MNQNFIFLLRPQWERWVFGMSFLWKTLARQKALGLFWRQMHGRQQQPARSHSVPRATEEQGPGSGANWFSPCCLLSDMKGKS